MSLLDDACIQHTQCIYENRKWPCRYLFNMHCEIRLLNIVMTNVTDTQVSDAAPGYLVLF